MPPLVSCLMPTANRRAFVPRAIEHFLAQDYPARELVILDDGAESVADLVPRDERIRYERLPLRTVLGKKRNLACEHARGELFVNWDGDDWFATWRLTYQIGALERSAADVCGLDRQWFFEPARDRAWRYVFPRGRRRWVAGGTCAFTRDFWRRNRFPEIAVGEDTRFVWRDRHANIQVLEDGDFYVALIHAANTSKKQVRDPRFEPAQAARVRGLMVSNAGRARGVASAESVRGPTPTVHVTALEPKEASMEAEPSSPLPVIAPPEDASAPVRSAGERAPVRVRVGLVVRDRAELVRSSLETLASSKLSLDVVLLADGIDAKTRATLPREGVALTFAWAPARGMAACFNRLVASGTADVYVLFENGARGGESWLERLLAALAADPCHGLAGPSTNLGWNEQSAFAGAGASSEEIAATARTAATRFGETVSTLEPLYSLSDFCYAVKREVVEALGPADEGYGLGPCWELDYNVRAARAGFAGVWVRGAYVWRSAPPQWKRTEEGHRFEDAKRRYQDRFCGLRLKGEKHDYEPHCKGDACPHFAPREYVGLRPRVADGAAADEITAAPAARSVAPGVAPAVAPSETTGAPIAAIAASPALASAPAVARHEYPLVSCIMPTFDRRPFVRLSVERFLEQDYPNKELVVVDDGSDAVADLLANVPGVRCIRLRQRQTIGSKRNLACSQTSGAVVVQWDDDDWYGPARLSRQVAPILEGKAELTGIEGNLVMTLPGGVFWRLSPGLHKRMFFGDVHGGTVAFARSVWAAGVRYPDASLAEDAAFLRSALERGYRLKCVANDTLFAYARHQHNAWRLDVGRHVDPQGWTRATAPEHIPRATIDAYRHSAEELARRPRRA